MEATLRIIGYVKQNYKTKITMLCQLMEIIMQNICLKILLIDPLYCAYFDIRDFFLKLCYH